MDISVETNPFIEAPTPAICPIGSMAIERKFPHRNPIHRNWKNKNATKTTTLGLGLFQNKNTYNSEMTQKAESAANESFRIPKRITKVPFKKVEIPTETASPAKIKGKDSFNPYWSSNTCCEALR